MRKSEFEKRIKGTFKNIREELEDHLDAINENTNEIQMNYEYLCEIDNKISKLSERIEELTLKKTKRFEVKGDLDIYEQELFLVLYTYSSGEAITYEELAKRLSNTQKMTRDIVKRLKNKGVEIRKIKINGKEGVFLDEDFKNEQAKRNIVMVSDKLVKNFRV